MQTIYTLLTSSMNGVHAMGTSAVSFLDRTLAEETKAAVESANENAFLRVHCRIQETKLFSSRDEIDILKPKVYNKVKAEIEANAKQWQEYKERPLKIITQEEMEKLHDKQNDQSNP